MQISTESLNANNEQSKLEIAMRYQKFKSLKRNTIKIA